MMKLLRSWRDSLLLLAPQNFKLFALVTLKSTFETYKVLARIWYVWLLSIVVLSGQLFSLTVGDWYNTFIYIIILIIAVSLTVLVCLASRSSIGQKNLRYFGNHAWYFCVFAVLALLFWQLNFWSYWLIVNDFISTNAIFFHPIYLHLRWLVMHGFLAAESVPSILHYYLKNIPANMFLTECAYGFLLVADFIPSWIFLILFFLDSDGGLKQLWYAFIRAIKMTIYNLPLLLILMSLIVLLHFALSMIIASGLLLLFYLFLLKPLIINLWTNIYIKKLHEMPDLYFKQPK